MAVPLTLSSVPAQTPYVQYVSGASQTVFPYPFEITQDSDLVCLINGVAQPTDGGYTLSGQGNTNGGNLTFTLGQTAGTIITLYRNISIARITQLAQNGTFFASNFNNEFNRIYLIMQQLQQSLLPGGNQAFALMIPNSNSPAPTTLLTPSAYANKYLSFDSNGNPQPTTLTSSGAITKTILGGLLYPQTAAEVLAGVVPTNLYVPDHTITGYANVARYGALGNGSADDSAAIANAHAVANQVAYGYVGGSSTPDFYKVSQCDVWFPPGDYIYNGTGLTATTWLYNFRGAGKDCTRIQIVQNVYFATATAGIMFAGITGLHFYGGKGVFINTGTAANTLSQFIFTDNIFFNYTETCIGDLSTNGPHWKIHRNQFHGALSAGERVSFGVVLGAGTDGSDILFNEFQENKVHVKLFGGAVAANVRMNIFERWTTSPGSLPSYDLWIVPTSTAPTLAGGAGLGIIVEGNRFGNENLLATDYHMLIADENTGAGSSEFNYLPKASTASTNFAGGIQVKNNECLGTGAASTAFCFSTTPNLWGMVFDNLTSGTPISTVDYLAGCLSDTNNAENTTNFIRQQHLGGPSFLLPAPTTAYAGPIEDPTSLYQNWNHVPAYWRTGHDPSGATDLTTSLVTGYGTSNSTIVGITDAVGGTEAIEMTATALGGGVFTTLSTPTTGRLGFVSFDVQVGASLALPSMLVTLTDNTFSSNAVVSRIISGANSQWRRITIPFCVVKGSATIASLFFSAPAYSAGVATKIRIGRVRVYHAQEAVHPGTKYLDSSVVAWSPGLINNGSQATTSVTVTGAVLGDLCVVSFDHTLSGCLIFANVTSANTVGVTIQNNTGGGVTPSAAGNVRVRVLKAI